MHANQPRRGGTEALNGKLIVAAQIPENRRLAFLPRHLHKYLLIGEGLIYASLESLCEDYNGGYWNYYDLSNGGFYLAPACQKKFHLVCSGNFFDGEVSADAAGIIATLMALNQLSWRTHSQHYIDRFYLLRDFAIQHAESDLILRAID